MATINASSPERVDVQAAINLSADGDTVLIPAGAAIWGASATALYVNKAITLMGPGPGLLTITCSTTAATGTAGVIQIFSAATVGGFTWQGVARGSPPFSTSADDWRITNVTYLAGTTNYFVFVNACTRGIIDSCDITSIGNAELIFSRGPSDAWQQPSGAGTGEFVFIEDCVFRGPGYVNDYNGNGRNVVRKCRIYGPMKVDGHGLASNQNPWRGCRIGEIYQNRWYSIGEGGYWPSIEIRGGTGFIFDNIIDDGTYILRGVLRIDEYGLKQQLPIFGYQYQTPYDYPISDQIGVGADPKAGGSEPMYIWNNKKNSAQMAINWQTVVQGAIDRYRIQTGDPLATFVTADVIKPDRDFFIHGTATFDGSTGIGIGTRAQMDAITGTKTGVGFWVTNEGNWDTTLPADTSGRLYRWNGSTWELHYTPYTYPHPARGALAAPVFLTQPIDQSEEEGATATIISAAAGNPAPTYQWRKGGVNISGKTAATLTLTNVQEADEGTYDCVVTNSEGTATSAAATLTVTAPLPPDLTAPTISVHPVGGTFPELTVNVTLSVTATGNPAVTYQWKKGGVDITNEDNATLVFSGISLADAGSYTVVVTNSEGSVTSNAAVIVVTAVADTSPPTPTPLTINSAAVDSHTQITVTATTATDVQSSPVEYNHAIDDVYQGWQSSATRVFTGLTAETAYGFRVKARDSVGNETDPSGTTTRTTQAAPIAPTSSANVLGNRGTRARRLGIF